MLGFEVVTESSVIYVDAPATTTTTKKMKGRAFKKARVDAGFSVKLFFLSSLHFCSQEIRKLKLGYLCKLVCSLSSLANLSSVVAEAPPGQRYPMILRLGDGAPYCWSACRGSGPGTS